MSKSKTAKFAEMNLLSNVLQVFDFHNPQVRVSSGQHVNLKGRWGEDVFGNTNPIVLELACGRAEYTVGLAQLFPDTNFLAVDLKGNRIWTGATKALELNLKNTAFLRCKIELLHHLFAQNEITGCWIIFPDPFVNPNDAMRRLTSPFYLDIYRRFFAPEALIHLKTDDDTLYSFTKKVIESQGLTLLDDDFDIYRNGEREGPLKIKTYYEGLHLKRGRKIKYLRFELFSNT